MKGSVRKRGDKWSYYFTIGKVDGKYKKKEKSGFATKKEAETALREALRQYETDGVVSKHSDYTLQEYIQYWFDTIAINYLKFETMHNYKCVATKHIYPEIGHLNIKKATPTVLQKYFSEKLKTYNADSIVSIIRNILSNTFKLAVKQNILPRNPMAQIELKSQKQKETAMRVVNKNDIDNLL
ncbi:site-specific integrase, partial [Turicibacter sanguinis]|nr:site-specific integrase [Turicibacter sanguinis]